MALEGGMIRQTEIKSSGDMLYELFTKKPHHISTISPDKVQRCELLDGEFGKKGSILFWKYFHDGKSWTAKYLVEEIDEANKILVWKVLEGDLMELYTNFSLKLRVETKDGNDLVTWILDYEKRGLDIEEPTELMDFLVAVVRDVEAHHLKQQIK